MIECPVCHCMVGADPAITAVHLFEYHQVVAYGWVSMTFDCAWCGEPLIGVAELLITDKTIHDRGCGLLAEHLERSGGAQAHYAASLLGIKP